MSQHTLLVCTSCAFAAGQREHRGQRDRNRSLPHSLTIAREQSFKFALGLMVRQEIAAIVFASILAWGGRFG